jgi:multimeric flavodoxin WrbA
MRVLAISGSPRKGGNSELLIHRAVRPFDNSGATVKIIKLSEKEIGPCLACESCTSNNEVCIVKDDMQQIYEDFAWCQVLILASPVYHSNISAQLMAVLNRRYAVKASRPLQGKLGGAIAVGRGAGHSLVLSQLYNWMLSSGMLCVPPAVRAIGSEPGDVPQEYLGQAEELGEHLGHLAEKL